MNPPKGFLESSFIPSLENYTTLSISTVADVFSASSNKSFNWEEDISKFKLHHGWIPATRTIASKNTIFAIVGKHIPDIISTREEIAKDKILLPLEYSRTKPEWYTFDHEKLSRKTARSKSPNTNCAAKYFLRTRYICSGRSAPSNSFREAKFPFLNRNN